MPCRKYRWLSQMASAGFKLDSSRLYAKQIPRRRTEVHCKVCLYVTRRNHKPRLLNLSTTSRYPTVALVPSRCTFMRFDDMIRVNRGSREPFRLSLPLLRLAYTIKPGVITHGKDGPDSRLRLRYQYYTTRSSTMIRL